MMTDGQLLERYVIRQDPEAFRDLVVRHGPAVLGVCRRILQDPHEAEDAFQATFVVLVRRAPSIQDPETLGNWLRGVAMRIANRIRRDAARRRERERRKAEMSPTLYHQDQHQRIETRRVLLEELERLPSSYQVPLRWCLLENQTHEEAAERLGLPLGTLKSRLLRGRKLLRNRLSRRGLVLGPGLVLLGLGLPKKASAVVSESLVNSTVQAMLSAGEAGFSANPAGQTVENIVDFTSKLGLLRNARWPSTFLLLVVLTLTTIGGLIFSRDGWAAGPAEPPELPANLMNVLAVDCL